MRTIFSVLALIISSLVFSQQVNWLSLEEATKVSKDNPAKPILVNVYTTWCGFCKKMDKETLSDSQLADYINKNYIPVKFDAETNKLVNFLGVNYSFIGGLKSNYLAYILTQGRLSYPATVVVDNLGNTQKIILGYRSLNDFTQDIKI